MLREVEHRSTEIEREIKQKRENRTVAFTEYSAMMGGMIER